jgi:hypothetical protein
VAAEYAVLNQPKPELVKPAGSLLAPIHGCLLLSIIYNPQEELQCCITVSDLGNPSMRLILKAIFPYYCSCLFHVDRWSHSPPGAGSSEITQWLIPSFLASPRPINFTPHLG